MDREHFRHSGQTLQVEGVSIEAICEQVGTPTYIYSTSVLRSGFDRLTESFKRLSPLICVSVKANSNLSLLKLLADRGAGFDIVSKGELLRVVSAGASARKVVFAGVGKTDDEIEEALNRDILLFNVESRAELERITAIAAKRGCKAPISLRVNPDVDAKTHRHISTGLDGHKFGIPFEQVRQILKEWRGCESVALLGLDCHIGSGITDINVFQEGFTRMRQMVDEAKVLAPTIEYVDLGGGLAAQYFEEDVPDFSQYAELIEEIIAPTKLKLIIEPGKSLFANAGCLATKVLYTKQNDSKRFIIVDAGFNDLIRPVLYEAHHQIVPVNRDSSRKDIVADIVGPVCETGDCFAKERQISDVRSGELIAIASAGAYGFTMASNYNTRPRPAEVLVDGDKFRVVRGRERVEALFQPEVDALNSPWQAA